MTMGSRSQGESARRTLRLRLPDGHNIGMTVAVTIRLISRHQRSHVMAGMAGIWSTPGKLAYNYDIVDQDSVEQFDHIIIFHADATCGHWLSNPFFI